MADPCQATDLNWLTSEFDASVWAREFVKLFPHMDEGTMLAWFANAIMAGYDEHARRYPPAPEITEDTEAQHQRECQDAYDAGVRDGHDAGFEEGKRWEP